MSDEHRASVTLGCMNFGKRTTASESERIILRALERGVRTFDTANVYNTGESEKIVGKTLAKRRGEVKIATKVGLDRVAGKPEGLTRKVILDACDASRKRLGVDTIDLYYLHAPDHGTPIAESLQAMAELYRASAILEVGVSNYASWQILEMLELAAVKSLPKPVTSQVLYNVIHRDIEIEYAAFARHYGVHTTIYNPLAGGLLAKEYKRDEAVPSGTRFDKNSMYRSRYWTEAMFAFIEKLRALALDSSMTLLDLAYSWAANNPRVGSIILGPSSVEQLDQGLDACARALPDDVRKKADALYRDFRGTDQSYAR